MTIQRGIIAVSAILLFNTLVSLRTTSAQTVQLPVFRSFSVNTSVSVPDRGSTSLGGAPQPTTATQFAWLSTRRRIRPPWDKTGRCGADHGAGLRAHH